MQAANPSKPAWARAALVVLAISLASGCNSNSKEVPNMSADSTKQPAGRESDPNLYKNNAVMGVVTAGEKPVPGAVLTIVATGATVPLTPQGTYIVVLDPAELGTNTHELSFKAPGYKEQRHTVTIPSNKRIRLDVVLVADDQ
jgi:hypothetical protein